MKPASEWLNEVGEAVAQSEFFNHPSDTRVEKVIGRIQGDALSDAEAKIDALKITIRELQTALEKAGSTAEKRQRLRNEGWVNEMHRIWISPDRTLIQIVFDDGAIWEGQRLPPNEKG